MSRDQSQGVEGSVDKIGGAPAGPRMAQPVEPVTAQSPLRSPPAWMAYVKAAGGSDAWKAVSKHVNWGSEGRSS